MKKKITDKVKDTSQEEIEKALIFSKADQIKGEQFVLNVNGELEVENEIKKMSLGNIDDPAVKYDIYYKGIRRLLMKLLPAGKEFKKARDLIYEEKNTYMTRGFRKNRSGIRNADSRMSYEADMNAFLELLTSWAMTNGTMADLYLKLRDLNVEKGYGVAIPK